MRKLKWQRLKGVASTRGDREKVVGGLMLTPWRRKTRTGNYKIAAPTAPLGDLPQIRLHLAGVRPMQGPERLGLRRTRPWLHRKKAPAT